ncbi:MAG: hypothetical protein ACLVH7_16840 [Flavonifractor plautii]
MKEPVSAKTKKAQLQQEVESAAQEVSQAIEQELAQGEEAHRYPPSPRRRIMPTTAPRWGRSCNNSRRLAEALRSSA